MRHHVVPTRAGLPAPRVLAAPRRAAPLAAALLALGALAAPAARGQTSIPDTIVTATRLPTEAERMPAAVTVIPRQEIESRGYQTLADALATVPGMNVVQLGGPGQQSSGFLRGTNSRHVLVLLDGVPLNDASEPSGAFNFGNELLFDVERIEVVRGPASALYGSAAIGGVVNLVTRRAPADRPFQVYGELAGGTQRTLRGGLGVTGKVEEFDYLFSGQSLSTRGFNTLAPRLGGSERDGFRSASGMARLGWTPVEGTRFEAMLRWRENHVGLDNIPLDDPNFSGQDRRWSGQLRAETRLLDGLWTTGLRLARTEDRRSYRNLADALSETSLEERRRGTRSLVEWGNTLRLPDLGQLDAGAFNFGVTHMLEEARGSTAIADPINGDYQAGLRAQQHTTAGHASLQYRAFGRLDLSAGVRHDAVDRFTGATTWRLGAVLAVPELNSRLRASVGTGFAAPSLEQRFGVSVISFFGFSSVFRGNPALRPETSTGWELGSETDLPAFGRTDFATAGFTFFQSRVKDLINTNRDFTSFINIARADIHGAELGLTLRPADWASLRVAWTITEAFDAATKLRLARRPEHVLSLGGQLRPLPQLTIAPTLLFTGRANDTATYDNAGNFLGRGSNKSGTLLNLTASWQVREEVALFVEGRNLGNSRWEPANGFVTPGRSLLIGTRFAL